MTAGTLPGMNGPDLVVTSRDGTRIVAFRSGVTNGPPLVLVHGTTADHTTFRAIGPRLADTFDTHPDAFADAIRTILT